MIANDCPYISVIIPSYNSFRTINNTIEKIIDQNTRNYILEIIIVDSSEDEKTKKTLENINCPFVKIINSGKKVPPGASKKYWCFNAKGKLLIFIDSDAYPASNWLRGIHEAYINGFMIGGGSYMIDNNQTKINHIVAQYYFEFGEFIPVGRIRKKKILPSCNLFCDKELFIKAKGFPDIRAAEDSLFGIIINQFATLYFFPDIKIYHTFRENIKESLLNQKLIGKYAIIYRKFCFPYLYGNKYLILSIFPFIFLYKFFKVYFRPIFHNPVDFLKQNKVLFMFLQCLTFWSLGVMQGILNNTQVNKNYRVQLKIGRK